MFYFIGIKINAANCAEIYANNKVKRMIYGIVFWKIQKQIENKIQLKINENQN